MIFWPGGSARRPGRASCDDRPRASHPVHPPPVPPAGGQPGVSLPPLGSGQRGRSPADGADRPPVPGAAVLRLPPRGREGGRPKGAQGSRRMAAWLATQGHTVNRKRVQRLMRLMGLVAIHQRPNTSKAAPEHTKYPYLLGGLTIDRVNQVWCTDITYIPLARGFIYLVAIMDWHSRAVLAWRTSNTLHADFCVEALEEALRRFGRPEIFNTDQGSQFTIHRCAEGPQHQDQHGWQGPVHGQHLRRAALEKFEI